MTVSSTRPGATPAATLDRPAACRRWVDLLLDRPTCPFESRGRRLTEGRIDAARPSEESPA